MIFTEKTISHYLDIYIDLIKEVNSAFLTHFSIPVAFCPMRELITLGIERKGEFNYQNQKINYCFHGSGVDYTVNDTLVLAFDYNIGEEEDRILIGIYKFFYFIETYQKYISLQVNSLQKCDEILQTIIEKKINGQLEGYQDRGFWHYSVKIE